MVTRQFCRRVVFSERLRSVGKRSSSAKDINTAIPLVGFFFISLGRSEAGIEHVELELTMEVVVTFRGLISSSHCLEIATLVGNL